MRYIFIFSIFWVVLFLSSCQKESIHADNVLIPATVDKNSALPQIQIAVAGLIRKVHIRTFGNPQDSVLFILHGGPGSDFRSFLPLQALSEKYYVIMWDQRGSGLSERIGKDEISFDHFVDEVKELKKRYAPNGKINIIGQSWGGMLACLYQSKYPGDVSQIVLIEPGPLTSIVKEEFERPNDDSNTFTSRWYANYTWFHELVALNDHNALDYKMMIAAHTVNEKFYCNPADKSSTPFWRFGGYIGYIAGEIIDNSDYDFTAGVQNYTKPILLIGSSCSSMGYDWQLKHHVPLLNNVVLKKIENSGHYLTFEQPAAVLNELKSYLENF